MKKTDLYIKIEKINEFAPKFDKDLYMFYVDENSATNKTVDFITAVDEDGEEDGIFGKVHYKLKNGQNR